MTQELPIEFFRCKMLYFFCLLSKDVNVRLERERLKGFRDAVVFISVFPDASTNFRAKLD